MPRGGAESEARRGQHLAHASQVLPLPDRGAAPQPVEIVGAGGEPLGRGFVGYSSAELAAEAGHSSAEEGHEEQRPAVHRDQMMLAD